MPQNERLRVWRNELKKTSGGLTRGMLIKNKRGKIVSKKKSEASKKNEDNNLGSWLRKKGDTFEGEPKGLKKEVSQKPVVNVKPKKGPTVVNVPKKKVAKKVVNPKKVVAKKVHHAPKKKKVVNPKKKKAVVKKKKVVNPAPKLTKSEPMKPGQHKDLSKVSVGNIVVKQKRSKSSYIKLAKAMKTVLKYTKDKVIKRLGPLPEGVTWESI